MKHAFYTRERRYCSLACARGSDDNDGSQELLQSPTNSQWSSEVSPLVRMPLSEIFLSIRFFSGNAICTCTNKSAISATLACAFYWTD